MIPGSLLSSCGVTCCLLHGCSMSLSSLLPGSRVTCHLGVISHVSLSSPSSGFHVICCLLHGLPYELEFTVAVALYDMGGMTCCLSPDSRLSPSSPSRFLHTTYRLFLVSRMSPSSPSPGSCMTCRLSPV